MEAALKGIQADLKLIKTQLTRIEHQADRMADHVEFVDNVYDRVKSPFHSMMRMVSGLTDAKSPQPRICINK